MKSFTKSMALAAEIFSPAILLAIVFTISIMAPGDLKKDAAKNTNLEHSKLVK